MALSNKAQLYALSGRDAKAIVMAEQAIALGQGHTCDPVACTQHLAVALYRRGDANAQSTMEESLRVALAADEPEHACGPREPHLRTWSSCGSTTPGALAEGIEFADRSDFVMFSRYLQAALGALHFATADWTASSRRRSTPWTARRR